MLTDGGGGSMPEPVVWSPDGTWIFFRVVLDGRIDLWRAAVDGSRTEQVTHDRANIRKFALSADGTRLDYSVGADREAIVDAERAEYDRGIHIDATVPVGQGLFRSSYVGGRMATQRYGGKDWSDRYVPLLADVPDHWMEVDLATGAKRMLAGSDVS